MGTEFIPILESIWGRFGDHFGTQNAPKWGPKSRFKNEGSKDAKKSCDPSPGKAQGRLREGSRKAQGRLGEGSRKANSGTGLPGYIFLIFCLKYVIEIYINIYTFYIENVETFGNMLKCIAKDLTR